MIFRNAFRRRRADAEAGNGPHDDSGADGGVPVQRSGFASAVTGWRLGVLPLGAAILLAAGLSYWLFQPGRGVLSGKPVFPEHVLLEDFQRPLDRDVVEQIERFEKTGVSRWVDAKILRPLFDDVNTRMMDVDGIESSALVLKDGPDLSAIAQDCARILGLSTVPRVYVASRPGLNAYTTNVHDPIIVLHSSVLRRFRDPAELRFLIGHEMGHIRCRHVKLLMVLRSVVAVMPDGVREAVFLPLLKWAREAEMSADNAGLICCQDLGTAERSLVRLVADLDDLTLANVDIDAYVAQRKRDVSDFADAVYFWRQLSSDHPFVPDRVEQMRHYAKSVNYVHLWQ